MDKIRILCVDDNPGAAELLQMCINLEPDMSSVGWLDQADELLDEVQKLDPDVVLIDLRMPGKEPSEAIREVSAVNDRVRIIVLSGFEDPQAEREVFDAGACDFVQKGTDPEAVFAAVRKAVGRAAPAAAPK